MQHHKLTLNGAWRLYYNLEDGQMPASLDEVKKMNWPFIESAVPGNVELDLCNSGIEQDPFYSENLYSFRKYEFYQWWFEREFNIPESFKGKRTDLVFHGLDTFASIWVNGILVAETDNMFIEHVIDITDIVRICESNHIAVRIKSPVNMARNMEYPVSLTSCEHMDEMLYIRKPSHSFGWDIAPRLLSAGIWRDVEIVARGNTYIKEVYYATKRIYDNKADLLVKYRFLTDVTVLDDFYVRIKGTCRCHIFEKICKTIFCSGECTIVIENPRLWWPKGYGEQELYEMTFELIYKDKVVDVRSERIGIRLIQIETKYTPGDEGEFKIIVNGCPILAKGSNWVALDALHSRDRQRLKKAHDLFDDLSCNIVRCWGGNVYEDHGFYDLCDERGMMVWQDFSLACGIYPQDDDFARVMEKEASAVVRKLRNHPSIILWAGDNEVDGMYYWNSYILPAARYNRISREILPRVIGCNDPFRNYIPSSPYIPDHITGDLNVPEQHNWGPRDYFKGDFYKHSSAHFISEIGYHGCPAVSTIKKFISPEKLWPWNNDEWDTHNTDYIKRSKRGFNRNELMANQIKIMFGHVPDNIFDFTLASQISQAEAKKFFIEMVRLKKWRRTGVIWWNVLDCWPQFSDAVVDYYFVKKLAYYYIKRVQNPICIMMSELENWEHKVIIGNDSNQTVLVDYVVEDGDTGEILISGQKLSNTNENIELGSIPSLAGIQKLYIIKWKVNGKQYANHYISGYIPFSFEKYKVWLEKIETLPDSFDSRESYM